jgi:hypothetical protein
LADKFVAPVSQLGLPLEGVFQSKATINNREEVLSKVSKKAARRNGFYAGGQTLSYAEQGV